MGWNDWYQYTCGITQSEVLANARALVSSGLAKLGYNYVNLDDCWMAHTRAADGQLQANPRRFPNGIKWLAGQIHSMGLKLGVYESAGTTTCQGFPGSYGHYMQDAQTFASWGVDFLKFDFCGSFPGGTTTADLEGDYHQMSQDLVATGRHIVFSEELPVAAGDANPANPNYLPLVSSSSTFANMWRVAPDENANFYSTVFGHLSADLPLASYAHPGAWNDLDMLLTGTAGFNWTVQQQETQMSIWAEMASPLLASSNLTDMSAATKAILGNKAVIAVDQDPLGKQGRLVAKQGSVDIVAKPLANGDVAVLFANTSTTSQGNASVSAGTIGMPISGAYAVQNLWTSTTRESAGLITASVPPESTVMYQVSPLLAGVGLYPPVASVSVSPAVLPAYQGSQFSVALPGQTITVPASFRNDGRAAVTNASLSLTAPTGWQVQGTTASAGAVPGGGSLSGTWQVTVPPGTTTGTYTLTGTARYDWNGQPGTSSGQSSFQVAVMPTGTPYLDQLNWLSQSSSFHSVLVDKSYFGTPLTIHGVVYPHGLWANSIATIYYYLGGNCSQFTANLGLDASVQGQGAVDYKFYADGKQVYDSGVVTNSTPTVHANVDVSGAHILELYVGEGNGTIQFGNADFGSPQLTCNS